MAFSNKDELMSVQRGLRQWLLLGVLLSLLWGTYAAAQDDISVPTEMDEAAEVEQIAAIVRGLEPESFLVTLLIVSGSVTLGRSMLLLANQVKPRRFIASLIVQQVVFIVTILSWVLSLYLFGTRLFGMEDSIHLVTRVVIISAAPLTYGILALLPYVGGCIIRALYALTYFLMWLLIGAFFDGLTFGESGVLIGLMGLSTAIVQRTLFRPLTWLENAAAGKKIAGYRQLLESLSLEGEN